MTKEELKEEIEYMYMCYDIEFDTPGACPEDYLDLAKKLEEDLKRVTQAAT